jgi:L-threonylcarbamoyladenylate synthase
MKVISNNTRSEIQHAANALKEGHLVAFPTETVYGLGADARNEKAVSRIYAVKDRPIGHPLIVHISSINKLEQWAAEVPEYARKIAKAFWPGPLTLILKRSTLASDFLTGSQDNVGLRVPSHPVAIALLTEFESLGGIGVAAPSANRFGAVSPTNSFAVKEEIGNFLSSNDLILDGGPCAIGIESTIINCTNDSPTILRPGAVTSREIQELLGYEIDLNPSNKSIKVPGLLAKHYSPKARVSVSEIANPGEGFIALASIPTPKGVIRLANPANIKEFAKCLYEAFREGDRIGLAEIKVIIPVGTGLIDAIKDRVIKSSY